VILRQFIVPVNFQPNPDLPELAMKKTPLEGFESEASKGTLFPSGGFFILGVIP